MEVLIFKEVPFIIPNGNEADPYYLQAHFQAPFYHGSITFI